MKNIGFALGALILTLAAVPSQSLAANFGGPSCNSHKGMSAVDMSQPTNGITTASGKSGYEALRGMGVNTIIRYYDSTDDGVSCKALLPKESDAIINAGFKIMTVYQHENDDPESFFIKGRGTSDAKDALKLAFYNGQPAGSAIYFAVDGVDQTIRDMVFEHGMSNGKAMSKARKRHLLRADRQFQRHIRRYGRFLKYGTRTFGKPVPQIRHTDIHPAIARYFAQVNEQVRPAGYKIGAYGSGAVCEMLLAKKLIDYCWLAQSTGWPGYDKFYASKRWIMTQQKTTVCNRWRFASGDKVWLDFNRVNATKGAWNAKDEILALGASKVPLVCK